MPTSTRDMLVISWPGNKTRECLSQPVSLGFIYGLGRLQRYIVSYPGNSPTCPMTCWQQPQIPAGQRCRTTLEIQGCARLYPGKSCLDLCDNYKCNDVVKPQHHSSTIEVASYPGHSNNLGTRLLWNGNKHYGLAIVYIKCTYKTNSASFLVTC